MKWIALVIVLGIAAYTWLTFEFRKPEPPNEPWTDQRARAEAARLAEAGWSALVAPFEPVAAFPESTGNVTLGPPMPIVGLLRDTTLDPWHLPIEVTGSMAPAEWPAGRPYAAYLSFDLDTDRMQIAGFTVFRKLSHLILVPVWARPSDAAAGRSRVARGRFLLNAGDVPPGTYSVTIVAIKSCARWTLEVQAP